MSDYKFEVTLMSDDVEGEIRDNEYELMDLIPELKDMVGFDQKNPNHHLDLWNHTLYALSLAGPDLEIRLALLLHDIGKPHCYTEKDGNRHYFGHPKVSSEMSKKILKRLHFDKDYIDEVCYLIENHDLPISKKLVETNPNLALKLYEIQRCDSMAHSALKKEKREAYLEKTKQLILANEDCML